MRTLGQARIGDRTDASPPATTAELRAGFNETLVIRPRRRNGVLRIISGTVWVTLHHDSRDFVLRAGECLTVHPHQAPVIATCASRCGVRGVFVEGPLPSRSPSWP